MLFFNFAAVAIAAVALFPYVFGAASTDEYRDADQLQSGYLPNHNMDPNVVNSASFGQLWRVFTGGADTTPGEGGGNEEFLAKPLVYTTLKGGYGGRQVVIACSETNWVYVLDAVNGTIYTKRQLHRPFLVSDIGCNDINPQVGITGTPVIDPLTDIMYLYSKTYAGTTNGYKNGIYYFHAIDVNTLQDVYPPVNVNGGPADNDPNHGIYFTGGTNLQRTSSSLINGAVWAGFGGHCDLFNFTGWVIGVDAPTGTVLTRFATEVGSFAPAQDGTNNYKAGGGGSGIWQSGMSLTSDSNNRLFFVTGNDNSHANIEQPASGRAFLGTLGMAIVNLAIDPNTRQLSLSDYFEPYEYISMDGGDRDLGSGGICGLDPTTFKGTNVAHIGVTVGKNGEAYVVNMDNLGGFANGPSGGDLVVQTLPMPGGGPIFGGAGSYPLEGGYLYMTPVGYATQVYKFVPDAQGNPSFTLVSQTPDISSGRVGVGAPTITTNKGQPGTAILWVTDVDAGLRAYYAVPQPNGSMKKINMPSTPAVNKYQRPAFGDGRLYLSTSDGHIICLGSPVAQPFTCSVPINFGSVTLGSTSTLMINCTANIAITKIVGLTLTNPLFEAQNSSLPTGPLTSGQKFSFPATFNLTAASIQDTVNTSYSGVKPGVASGDVTLYTVNSVTGFATNQPLALSAMTVSQDGFISLSPVEVDFGGLVVNSTAAEAGLSGSLIISNIGVASLTITGSAWADLTSDTPAHINISQIGTSNQYGLGPAFNATNWPQPGYVIAGGASISISLNFKDAAIGTFGSLVTIWSTAASSQNVILSGTMSNAPVAKLTVNNGEGGSWQPDVVGITPDPSDDSTITSVGVDFGNLYPGNSSIFTIRINNTGGSSLLVTKSKPPEGVELTAVNPTGDLPEGSQIAPNSHADGAVLFAPSLALSPINSDPRLVSGTWILNNDDLTFGLHEVNFTGTVIVKQHGPLNAAGNSIYKYLGCYLDSANGGPRLFPQSTDNGVKNENGLCQNQASAGGAVFAGTEYHTQCWWGNTIPNATFYYPESADRCSWVCPGDGTQPCGGDGGYINVFYDSTKYNPTTGICTGCNAPVNPIGGGGGGGGAPAPVVGVIEEVVGDYNYTGCYTESKTGRALSGGAYAYDSMTPDSCAANCTGFNYFGVEYGRECYCGNVLGVGSVISANGDADCNMPCAGNSTELCGAGSRLTLYSSGTAVAPISNQPSNKPVVGSYSYYQCRTEATNTRALSAVAYANDSMTIEMCISTCAGYIYAGAEYGRECYCGNSFNAGSVTAPGGDADCSMVCAGDDLEFCGAGGRLSVYMLNGAAVSSSSITSISTSAVTSISSSIVSTASPTSSSTSATPSPSAPSHVPSVAHYKWAGCYTEATNSRALNSATLINYNTMTVEACASFCGPTYLMFGVEYSGECYCGNALQAGSVEASIVDCSMICDGNPQEYCGGPSRLDIYQQVINSVPSAKTGGLVIGSSASPSTTSSSSSSSVSTSLPTTSNTSSSSAPSSTSSSSSTSTTASGSTTTSSSTTASILTTASSSTTESSPTSSSSTSTMSGSSTVSSSTSSSGSSTASSSTSSSSSSTASSSSTVSSSSSSSTVSSSSSSSTVSSSSSSSSSTTVSSSIPISSSTYSSTSTYSSSASTTSAIPATYTGPPVISQGNVNFTYYDCLGEPANGRALPYVIESSTKMTVERCLEECWQYNYVGLEWSQECWCANSITTGTTFKQTGCNMPCTGNSSEICGGSVRLTAYQRISNT